MPPAPLVVVSYGGGVNSTALLWGMFERGIKPDLVLFADTGGEFDFTYTTVCHMRDWCVEQGIEFAWLSNADYDGDRHGHTSLEDECHRNVTLPSLAFGFKGCSARWKRQPMDRFIRDWQPAKDAWERGERIERWMGIDADESHRSQALCDDDTDKRFTYHRPLIGWDWGRDECVEAIERSPFDHPGKSACWFCPAAKKKEVLALAKDHPDLFDRAVEMERIAAPSLTRSTKGLGRSWSWKDLVAADRAQLRLFPESMDEACGCYDGEAE